MLTLKRLQRLLNTNFGNTSVTIFLVVSLTINSYAQDTYYLIPKAALVNFSIDDKVLVDSMLNLYHKSAVDTNKIKHLEYLTENISSYEIRPLYNRLMLMNCVKRIQIKDLKSSELNFLNLKIGECYGRQGFYHARESKYSEAYSCYKKAEEILPKYGLTDRLCNLYANIGFLHIITGNPKKAINYYYKSLDVAEKIKDNILISASYVDISIIFSDLNERDKAISFMKKALEYSLKTNDTSNIQFLENISRIYNAIGKEYLNKNDLVSAKKYFSISLKKIRDNDNVGQYADTYCSFGHLYHKANLLDSAIYFYNKVIIMDKSKLDPIVKTETLKGLIRVLIKKGDFNLVKVHLNDYEVFVNNFMGPYELRSFAEVAQEFYVKTGNYQKALDMSNLYRKMNDSILNDKIKQEAYKANIQKEYKEKENELIFSQKEKLSRIRETNNYKNIVIIFFIVFLITVTVSLVKNRKKNAIISESLKVKELLLKEIHHRVKNNLQVISSLLKLHSSEINDARSKAVFEESQSRINSISIIHHQLYQHDVLAAIELKQFVIELMNQVSGVYKAPNQTVETDIQIQETYLDVDTSVPLGLILNELLTNSFKYAFKSNCIGKIFITLYEENFLKDKKKYTLVYKDNGPGLNENIDPATARSIGMWLIMRLSKQIGGETQYAFKEGSEFKVTFVSSINYKAEKN